MQYQSHNRLWEIFVTAEPCICCVHFKSYQGFGSHDLDSGFKRQCDIWFFISPQQSMISMSSVYLSLLIQVLGRKLNFMVKKINDGVLESFNLERNLQK